MVISAFSLRDAANQFLNGDFDLVLLDKSLPTKDKDRMASFIRVSGSRTPVVAVGSERHDDTFVDATFDENPDNLLRGIKNILVKTGIPLAEQLVLRDGRETPHEAGKKPCCSSGHRQNVRHDTKAS